MQIIYARQPFPERFSSAIFLAGPTPRDPQVPSWRPRAIEYLESVGYQGAVFVPEDNDGSAHFDYMHQVDWEERGLLLADAIVFWIPRDLQTLPGFTTNIEWGVWHNSGKAILGAPPDAPKMRYLRHYAKKHHIPRATTLEKTLDRALEQLKDGAERSGGEREVPLFIWQQRPFQRWYEAQKAAGHRLDGAKLNWHFRSGPNRNLFCWALKVRVYIPTEDRHKSAEVLISRSDISAVLAYKRGESLAQTEVVLVREFRSNGASSDGFVHELPGGSSFDEDEDARSVAAEELQQETGVSFPAERFSPLQTRQCMATLLTHRASLFSIELTEEEMQIFKAREGQRFGEHDSERTYVEVRSVAQLLGSSDVDWSNIGMILSALCNAGNR